MKILQFSHKMMLWMGLYLRRDASQRSRHISNAISAIIMISFVVIIVLSSECCYSQFNEPQNLTFAILQLAANIASLGTYYSFVVQKMDIIDLFDDLQILVDKSIISCIFS